MKLNVKMYIAFATLSTIALIGCGGGGGGGGGGAGNGSGTLAVSLVDQTTYDYEAVYITIDEVQIHLGGNESNPNNWRSTNMPVSPLTVNLLELVSGVREDLGLAALPAGRYTQMRLIIGKKADDELNILSQKHPFPNYVIVNANPAEIYELKVPSGGQTGEKIVGGFIIRQNQTTELILDFDVQKSVVKAGKSGQWLLKPTIKVADLLEFSRIEGRVTTDTGTAVVGLEGVQVSAQVSDPFALDEKDKVAVRSATFTNRNGDYTLFVAPGSYNLVVYGQGFTPQFEPVTTAAGDVLTGVDFELASTASGLVTGVVTITGGDPEQYATLSFRQSISPNEEIQVEAVNVKNMAAYEIFLPEGEYRLVASTFGYKTQVPPNVNVFAEVPEIPDVRDVEFN